MRQNGHDLSLEQVYTLVEHDNAILNSTMDNHLKPRPAASHRCGQMGWIKTGIREELSCLDPNATTSVRKPHDMSAARVPKVGLEPTRVLPHRILSPARLPFRHFGMPGSLRMSE